jgi:opacity protein-like surface antigen
MPRGAPEATRANPQQQQAHGERPRQTNDSHAATGRHVRPGDRPAQARPHAGKHQFRAHHYRPLAPSLHWSLGWFIYPHSYWYAGSTVVVAGGSGGSAYVEPRIDRAVDRYDTFSLGAKVGTTLGAYGGNNGTYSDTGIGVNARYRLAEPIGLELAYNYSANTDPDAPTRYTHMVQPSVQLFLFPWTRVSPYGTLGLTFDTTYDADRGVNGQAQPVKDSAWGVHAGLGIEFAIGDNFALDIEARGIQYVEGHPDTLSTQLQTSVGLNYYF